jgi:hypothetical protein
MNNITSYHYKTLPTEAIDELLQKNNVYDAELEIKQITCKFAFYGRWTIILDILLNGQALKLTRSTINSEAIDLWKDFSDSFGTPEYVQFIARWVEFVLEDYVHLIF